MKTSILKYSAILLLAVFVLSGCRKDVLVQPSATKATSMDDLKVSKNFNWAMTSEVTLNIGMNIPEVSYQYNSVTVFSADPSKGGEVLFNGFAGNGFPMQAKVRVPTAVKELYIQLTPWNATSQIVVLPVTSAMAYTFKPVVTKNTKEVTTVVDCDVYDYTLSGSGNTTINDGKVYSILFGTSYSGSVDVKKGTLKICGTFTGDLAMGDNSTNSLIVISSTGIATVGSFSKDKNSVLENYGTLTINNNFTPKELVHNYGIMNVNAMYNMNGSDGILINDGTLTINSHWNVIGGQQAANPQITNNHFIEVTGDMNCNQTTFLNACKLVVHGFFHLNNTEFTNQSGYIKCYGELKTEGGQSFMKLIDQSMIETYDLKVNQDITGITTPAAPGTRSEIKVTNDIFFTGQRVITGTIETAQTNGVLANGGPGNFTNGATFVSFAHMTNSIPATECNGGNTPPPPPPPPPVNNWVTGTAVYEDLWPAKGDYDVNDLVMYYKFKLVTNQDNKVTDMQIKLYVKAMGASFKNGFGIQFDNLSPSDIASVTGYNLQHGYISLGSNGTENGQSKAVVIAFDDANNVIHRVGSSAFFNTEMGVPVGTADTVTLNIHFTTPLLTTVIGAPPYNPFLIRNMERQAEIHLPDYVPTNLGENCSYFGTDDDNSIPAFNRFYKTVNNLPWALNIPVVFDYPWEKTNILAAYNYFAAWAESDGVIHPDWYLNLSGYRNAANIWHP